MEANGSERPRKSSRSLPPTPLFLASASPELAGWVRGLLGSAHVSKAVASSGNVVIY